VKFVTLKAYEKTGGKLKRDLFSDDARGVYIEDPALLDTLVAERLEKLAMPVRAEGWKWVEVCADFGNDQSSQYQRIHAEPVPLTERKQKALDKLQEEYDQLNDAWNDSADEEAPARLDELEKLISEINNRDAIWTPEQLAVAGAVVSINHQGKVDIQCGLVRPEDIPKRAAKPKGAKTSRTSATDGEAEQAAGLSSALVESLTAQRSAALAASLLDAPDKGLAVVVYAMVMDILGHQQDTALQVSGKAQSLHLVEGSKAFQRLEDARETWGRRIPRLPCDVWRWCLGQDQAVLIDLLTFCAACTLNAVQMKADRPDCPRLHHAGQVAVALQLDMTAWFTPTAENYFSRVSKPQVLEALLEARQQPPAPAWEKLKKAELATLAERELSATRWLPKLLR